MGDNRPHKGPGTRGSTKRSVSALSAVVAQTDADGKAQYVDDRDVNLTPDTTTEDEKVSGWKRFFCCCSAAAAPTKPVPYMDSIGFDSADIDYDEVHRARSEIADTLLPAQSEANQGRKCLVLDLDETLVHSSFAPVPEPDLIIPVEIDGLVHHVYVRKRAHCDSFLEEMSKLYEIVLFTASLNKYADPLLDELDPHQTISARLFRESCVYYQGKYVKDLALMNRDLSQTIIVDNSPCSYMFHPENAIGCESFIDDMSDHTLHHMTTFLKRIAHVKDVRTVLHSWTGTRGFH